MNAKTKILQRLADRRSPPEAAPQLPPPLGRPDDLIRSFSQALEAAGGEAELLHDPVELPSALKRSFSDAEAILDTRHPPTSETLQEQRRFWDLAIVEGKFGVAENGAVWVEWQDQFPRSVLTLAENLALILPKKALVATMQEAYEALDLSAVPYGLFLAGPSKTADIEQALVIGAHGAIRLRVFLL